MTIASGGAVRLVRNSGIGGQKSVDMLNRFTTDVLAYKPATVLLATGTNDPDAIVDSLTNIESMIKLALNSGVSVILANIPPKGVPSAPPPTSVTLTPSTTSGTLPAGTYGYVITTETNQGQSLPSTEVTATLSSAGSIQVDWNRPTFAPDYRYRIYRRNPGGSLGFVFGVGPGFAVANPYPRWNDTGSVATPTTAPPSTDASGTGNYSGLLPAGHDNMIKTQKVIKKLARKYNVPLIDQYSLLTDSATGRFKQGYSSDGVHPTSKVQKLMGQNAWDTVKNLFPPHQPFLCVEPYDYSGLLPAKTPSGQSVAVAGALLPQNTSLGVGAIPHSWGQYGSTNFTTNLAPEAGVVGNAFTVTSLEYGAARINNFTPIAVTPGRKLRVAFKFKTSGLDLNNGNVTISLAFDGKTSGPGFLTKLSLLSDVTDWSVWTAEETVPPGTTSMTLVFSVLGRNVSGSIAQVTLDDLTAQGLA
jgi:lysophospholipase L1-like esterase